MKLKPCPCGKVPTGLNIDSEGGKWAYVSGNCCSQWSIEFMADYQYGDSLMAIAVDAWNGEARAESSLIGRLEKLVNEWPEDLESKIRQIIDEHKEG